MLLAGRSVLQILLVKFQGAGHRQGEIDGEVVIVAFVLVIFHRQAEQSHLLIQVEEEFVWHAAVGGAVLPMASAMQMVGILADGKLPANIPTLIKALAFWRVNVII